MPGMITDHDYDSSIVASHCTYVYPRGNYCLGDREDHRQVGELTPEQMHKAVEAARSTAEYTQVDSMDHGAYVDRVYNWETVVEAVMQAVKE